MDSMKQDLQLLLHKVFHLINVSCSILNTSLMHFYLNLKIHPLDACHLWLECGRQDLNVKKIIFRS